MINTENKKVFAVFNDITTSAASTTNSYRYTVPNLDIHNLCDIFSINKIEYDKSTINYDDFEEGARYLLANSIDWNHNLNKLVSATSYTSLSERARVILENGFETKILCDAWHMLLRKAKTIHIANNQPITEDYIIAYPKSWFDTGVPSQYANYFIALNPDLNNAKIEISPLSEVECKSLPNDRTGISASMIVSMNIENPSLVCYIVEK